MAKNAFSNLFPSIKESYLLILPQLQHFIILGYTSDAENQLEIDRDLIGNSLDDVITEVSGSSEAPDLITLLFRAVNNKSPVIIEKRNYLVGNNFSKQEQKSFSIECYPFVNDQNKVVYILLKIIGESVPYEINKTVGHGIASSLDLLIQIPMAICIVEKVNYRIAAVNDICLQLWNKDQSIIGKRLMEGFAELVDIGQMLKVNNVLKNGVTEYSSEIQLEFIRNNDQKTIFINLILQPLRVKEGYIFGLIIIMTDITSQVLSRKNSEAIRDQLKFQNALLNARSEATPDGVLVTDGKGGIITFNRKFAEIWNIPLEIMNLKDDNLALEYAMTQFVDPQGFRDRINYLYFHPEERSYDRFEFKDGKIIEAHGLPILAEDGTYYGWAWYARDITERVNQLLSVEKVRQKVARDLHDDVGSVLTSISIFSDIARTKADKDIDVTKMLLDKISYNSKQMMEAMSDIVWSINPMNDNTSLILSRMREYAVTLLEAKNIQFSFIVDKKVEDVDMSLNVRLDFYLIFKEAVNNLVKYSLCSFADINIFIKDENLVLMISDNGIGFDTGHSGKGNGLDNIRKRAKQLTATLSIESKAGLGTTIILEIPILRNRL